MYLMRVFFFSLRLFDFSEIFSLDLFPGIGQLGFSVDYVSSSFAAVVSVIAAAAIQFSRYYMSTTPRFSSFKFSTYLFVVAMYFFIFSNTLLASL